MATASHSVEQKTWFASCMSISKGEHSTVLGGSGPMLQVLPQLVCVDSSYCSEAWDIDCPRDALLVTTDQPCLTFPSSLFLPSR